MYSPVLTPTRGEEQTRRFTPSERSATYASTTSMASVFTKPWPRTIRISHRLGRGGLGAAVDFGEFYMPVHAFRRVLSSSVLAHNKRRTSCRGYVLRVMVHGLRRLRALLRSLLLKRGKRGDRKRYRHLSGMRISR
jgi:hypothetical protein